MERRDEPDVACPDCGLALPPYARFCARCGVRLPERPGGTPVWALALLWLGVPIAAAAALAYGVAAAPGMADQMGVGAEARSGALVFALAAAALFCVQLAAAVGLTAGRPWAKVAATLACVVWALTCVGLPLALLVLSALWRPLKPAGSAVRGRPPR
jgi:hypothetical protein